MNRPCIEGCGRTTRETRCPACQLNLQARRGANGWRRQLANAEILARDMQMCRKCGGRATEVDHVVPLARGGSDDSYNKQSLCSACHTAKTNAQGRGR